MRVRRRPALLPVHRVSSPARGGLGVQAHLHRLSRRSLARLATRRVPVLLRVSPGLDAATHEAMATGHDDSKFGIPTPQVEEAIARIREVPALYLRGLHAHVGSQLLDGDCGTMRHAGAPEAVTGGS